MIILGKPTIKYTDSEAILENTIEIDGKKDIIWFKVNKKFSEYLCDERNDAYLIACLNYAMRNNHDIISKTPITEALLFNIEQYLVPALIENNPEFYNLKITTELSNDPMPNYGAVGTGISCGVDSLHALANHSDSKFKDLNITHLTFNNVGSHGEGEVARKLFNSRIDNPSNFAKEYGFEIVISDSNLMDVIKQNHFKTHTYSSMFPVFCLQKLFSSYFYASGGYKFNEFQLKDLPTVCPGSYELLSLSVFTTPNIRIYSEGMGKSRMDKLRSVIYYRPSYKYLNVCLSDGNNCNKCEKCVRTLLELDALDSVDLYEDVFDIEYYKTHKKWYLQQMLYRIKDKKHDYFEIYPFFKDQVDILMKVRAFGYYCYVHSVNLLKRNKGLYRLAKSIKQKLSNA